MKSNGFKITCVVIVAVLLLAGVGTSICYSLKSYKAINEYVKEMHDKEEPEETQENDVTIAGSYKIRSTEAISDAYKSGDTSALDDKQKETLDMASKILDEIITDGMSDYEKETAVYDWMCKNLANDSNLLVVIPAGSGDSDNPYGVLKYHNAVCVGYATTFRLFMQMMDIECMVVHNTECYHSWDLVKIDGDWYHTDIYSDVGRGQYAYFNLPDSMRSQQESWDTSFFPAATSLKRNKAMENIIECADLRDIPGAIGQAIMDGKLSFVMKFNCEVNEEFARRAIAVIDIFSNAIDTISFPNGGGMWMNGYRWLPDDNGGFVLWVSVNKYGEEEDNSDALTEEERDEITSAIYEMINTIQEKLGGNGEGEGGIYDNPDGSDDGDFEGDDVDGTDDSEGEDDSDGEE